MGFLRFCLVVLAFVAATLKVTPAQAAGTVTLSTEIWQQDREDRPAKTINHEDCVKNNTLRLGISFTSIGSTGGLALEVWAGSACDMIANRTNTSGTRTCVLVKRGSLSDRTIDVNAADLVKPATDTSDPPVNPANVCNPTSTTSGVTNRSLFVIVYDTGSNTTVSSQHWDYGYDITGPAAPTAVSASAGDTTLVTSFTGTKDTDVQNYRFFCIKAEMAPAGSGGTAGSAGTAGTAGTAGAATAGTAGTGGTAGADTGGTGGTAGMDAGGTAGAATAGTAGTGGTAGTSGTAGTAGTAGSAGSAGAATVDPGCYSSVLVPGTVPMDNTYACGTVAAQGSNGGETDPKLENGFNWAVAIAAVDGSSNVGPLSNLACATPKDTVGYYEAYRRAGGQGGGGFCTFAPSRRGSVAILIGMLGFGALAVWRRRR